MHNKSAKSFKEDKCEQRSFDRAMAQVVSRRPLTAEARVRSRANPCGICGSVITLTRYKTKHCQKFQLIWKAWFSGVRVHVWHVYLCFTLPYIMCHCSLYISSRTKMTPVGKLSSIFRCSKLPSFLFLSSLIVSYCAIVVLSPFVFLFSISFSFFLSFFLPCYLILSVSFSCLSYRLLFYYFLAFSCLSF